MEHTGPSFASFLLVVSLAFFAPIISHSVKKMAVPLVVIEIIGGIVFGKSGLNLIKPDVHLQFLAAFGFAFLMFLSGLEIDVEGLLPSRKLKEPLYKSPLIIGLMRLVIVSISAFALGFWLHRLELTEDPILIAFLLINTSIGIVMPTLKEAGESGKNEGKYILVSTLVADIASILGLSTYVAISKGGAVKPTIFAFIIIFSGIIAYKAIEYYRGKALWIDAAFQAMAHGTAQLPLRAIFALLLLFIVESELLGTEVMLGAFTAGLTTSILLGAGGESLKKKLDAIGFGLLIPIFFIMIGANLDVIALLKSSSALPLVGALLLGIMAINVIGAVPLMTLFGLKKGLSMGMLLMARLSLTIAGAAIGVQAGLISQATEVALILFSIICCILGPVFYHHHTNQQQAVTLPTRKMWLIVGNSKDCINIGHELLKTDIQAKVITQNSKFLEVAHSPALHIEVIHDLSPEALVEHGLSEAEGVILVVGNTRRLVELGRVLKHHYMVDNIYALTNDEMTSLLLKEIGIKSFTPKEASWLLLREMVQAPFMTSALLEQTEEKVFELDVEPGPLNGKTLMELAQIMPKDVRVLLVTRNGEVIMPKGTTLIKEGDTLTLIGKEESLKTLEDLCVGGVCKIK